MKIRYTTNLDLSNANDAVLRCYNHMLDKPLPIGSNLKLDNVVVKVKSIDARINNYGTDQQDLEITVYVGPMDGLSISDFQKQQKGR